MAQAEQFRRTVDAMAAEQEAQRQHLKSALEAAELRHQQELAKVRSAAENELLEFKADMQLAQSNAISSGGNDDVGLRQLLMGLSAKVGAGGEGTIGVDAETHQEMLSLRDQVQALEHEAAELRKTVAAANRRCQVCMCMLACHREQWASKLLTLLRL